MPSRASWVDRLRARLTTFAPPGAWRVLGAFGATWLSVSATAGGLFLYQPEVQAGVLGGACASLIARDRRTAAAVAAVATFVGMAIGPASWWGTTHRGGERLLAAGAAALVAAVVALVAKVALERAPRAGRWLTWAVALMLVANIWATTIYAAGQRGMTATGVNTPSMFEVLSGEAPADSVGEQAGDLYAYLRVLQALKRGQPFYRTWHDELGPLRDVGGSAGASVFNYHLPTPFWFWAALPGSPVSVLYAYMTLVSLAVLSVPFAVRGTVRLPLAIPGAAAVAAYLFVFGTVFILLSGEVWAGTIGVLSVSAVARSSVSPRWRSWTVAAVVLGVLAPLVREPAFLLLLAGLASALWVRDGQRTFRIAAWATGLATFAVLYLAHYLNVRPLLSGAQTTGAMLRLSGPDTILSALTFATMALGRTSTLPLVLAVAGLLGVLAIRDRRTAVFAGLAAYSSLAAYLVVNNGAWDAATGAPVNYWGIVIVPVIYACVPAVFAFVPTMVPAYPAPPAAEDAETSTDGAAGPGDDG